MRRPDPLDVALVFAIIAAVLFAVSAVAQIMAAVTR